MNKMKKFVNNIFDKIKTSVKKAHKEHVIKKFFKENPVFITYVIVNLINSTMIRFFTIHTVENYLSYKAVLADLAVIIIIGSFSFLFKRKGRYNYLCAFTWIFTMTCMINSIYYTFYTSYASFSMLSLTQYLGDVGDAVVQNVIQPKDIVYLFAPFVLMFVNKKDKKNGAYKRVEFKETRRHNAFKSLVVGVVIAVIFVLNLTSLDVSRFAKQWNKEYVVMKFGIYIYQINDGITSLQPKINSMFGLNKALNEVEKYYDDRKKNDKYASGTNEYTDIFKGKNVIVIHGESFQTINIDREFNGVPVAPNMSNMAHEGLYFSNYYSQVSVGTSSDAELTFNTSLMPTQRGTAFVSYFDRKYIALPQIMKDNGYYTFSMHGNNADFWNRRVMHKNFGYERFYSKKDYDITEENTIGLGISDKAFFKQSVEKMKKIYEKHKKFYGLLIMLSNHTPFSDTEKYGPYDVSLKETVTNEDGTTSEVTYPYMEGTKLGNYFKSVHYADSAMGELITELDEAGLLDNTVIVFYGDHDARLPQKDYNRLFNYDKETDGIKSSDDPTYVKFDSYQYELNRKVPFIIWTKDHKYQKEIKDVMGMYDAMPTLANMLGVKASPYALGHDIFNIKDNNIVVFPTGNWLTNRVYYNSQKSSYLALNAGDAISKDYIKENTEYANKLLEVSNNLITYDLVRKEEEKEKASGGTKK